MVSGQISADLVEWLAADQKVRKLGVGPEIFQCLFFSLFGQTLNVIDWPFNAVCEVSLLPTFGSLSLL